jgi:Leucine-rich repeat (LRR) protein
MKQLNNDCLIYIAKFLSFRDKIAFIQTCKQVYNLHPYIFKDGDLVEYRDDNTKWLKKYKPKIKLTKISKKILAMTSIVPNIHTLDLHGLRLNIIPESIFELVNLKFLYLSQTNIRIIPNDISKLTHLQHLGLSGNRIKDFSPCCSISKLQTLYLCHNKITEIPDKICNLTNLQKLNLEFNSISYISPRIDELQNLRQLTMFANCITTLPKTMKNLKLTELYIDLNQLSCICNCIPNTLVYLDVSDNENLSCNLSLTSFKNLQHVAISDTSIQLLNLLPNCNVTDD